MDKIVISLLFSLVFSCQNAIDARYDEAKSELYSGVELYDFGLEFDEFHDIGVWIRNNIDYEVTHGYMKDPKDTWDDGTGDCKAMAALFMDMAYFSMGVKCELVCVDSDTVDRITTKQIVNGGVTNHLMVMYDGVIYEPCGGYACTAEIGYKYSFDHVFN